MPRFPASPASQEQLEEQLEEQRQNMRVFLQEEEFLELPIEEAGDREVECHSLFEALADQLNAARLGPSDLTGCAVRTKLAEFLSQHSTIARPDGQPLQFAGYLPRGERLLGVIEKLKQGTQRGDYFCISVAAECYTCRIRVVHGQGVISGAQADRKPILLEFASLTESDEMKTLTIGQYAPYRFSSTRRKEPGTSLAMLLIV